MALSKEKNEFLDKSVDMPKFLQQHKDLTSEIELYLHKKQWLLEKYDMYIEDLHDKETDSRIRQGRIIKAKHESAHTSPQLRNTEA
jgi:hypothetical protein